MPLHPPPLERENLFIDCYKEAVEDAKAVALWARSTNTPDEFRTNIRHGFIGIVNAFAQMRHRHQTLVNEDEGRLG